MRIARGLVGSGDYKGKHLGLAKGSAHQSELATGARGMVSENAHDRNSTYLLRRHNGNSVLWRNTDMMWAVILSSVALHRTSELPFVSTLPPSQASLTKTRRRAGKLTFIVTGEWAEVNEEAVRRRR
jgi:hypothetical protein